MTATKILIPTVGDDGKIMSNRDAISQYRATGQHLGIFNTPDAATAYALRLRRKRRLISTCRRRACLRWLVAHVDAHAGER